MIKRLTSFFVLLSAISVGAALSGCAPKADHIYANGVATGALTKPVVNPSTILVWANEAVITAYTYDFNNYQTQLQKASQYFTTEGWQTFMTALTASGNLTKVVEHKMVVSAVATGSPIVLSQGELAGRYSWKVQMPVLVTYLGANASNKQNLIVTMLIVRTGTAEGTRGLGIKQFIATAQPQAKTQIAATGMSLNH